MTSPKSDDTAIAIERLREALRGALGALSEALELVDEYRPDSHEYSALRSEALRSQMENLDAMHFDGELFGNTQTEIVVTSTPRIDDERQTL